jgi:cell division transport system permease protein
MFALISILVTYQFYITLDRIIHIYEENILNDYSIIIVSPKTLSLTDITAHSKNIKEMIEVDADIIVDELRDDLSGENITVLKNTLPKFYKLKLYTYPTTSELNTTVENLKNFNQLLKVESFAKAQNKIYGLMEVVKMVTLVFLGMISNTAILLMIKQMEVWKFEHSERMNIMAIFGAPLWMRSGVLFRLGIIDSILSTLATIGIFYYIMNEPATISFLNIISINTIQYDVVFDSLVLFGIAFGVSLFSVIMVIFKKDRAV